MHHSCFITTSHLMKWRAYIIVMCKTQYKYLRPQLMIIQQGTNGHFAFLEEYLPFSSGIPSDSIPTSQCRTSFCRCLNIESERMVQ